MTVNKLDMPAPSTAPQIATINPKRFWITASLLTVYIVWGTTYLGSHIAMASFPPYLLMGIRFLIAGIILYVGLRLNGSTPPTLAQWRNSTIAGGLIIVGGTGSIALAQNAAISSGLAATLVATVPLWTLIFGLIWKKKPGRYEWIGVGLGIVGVAVMTMEGNLQANPIGVGIILFGAASWAFGSVLSTHLNLPKGMMINAAQMLMAGILFLVFSALRGEHMVGTPTSDTLWALIYLITFGSLGGMSAYIYLLSNVSPLLATSYTFVNPVIALLLGVFIGGEVLTGSAFIALPLILLGVGFVAYRKT